MRESCLTGMDSRAWDKLELSVNLILKQTNTLAPKGRNYIFSPKPQSMSDCHCQNEIFHCKVAFVS